MRKFLAFASILFLSACCAVNGKLCCNRIISYGDDFERMRSINMWSVYDMSMACEKALVSSNFQESNCGVGLREVVERKKRLEFFARLGPVYDFEQCINNGQPITNDILKRIATDLIERAKIENQKEVCAPMYKNGSYIARMYNCPDITKLEN